MHSYSNAYINRAVLACLLCTPLAGSLRARGYAAPSGELPRYAGCVHPHATLKPRPPPETSHVQIDTSLDPGSRRKTGEIARDRRMPSQKPGTEVGYFELRF